MNWQDLCNRRDLQNLPFKIELDAKGKVIMSPVKVYHSALQGEIAAALRLNRKDGKILPNSLSKHQRELGLPMWPEHREKLFNYQR